MYSDTCATKICTIKASFGVIRIAIRMLQTMGLAWERDVCWFLLCGRHFVIYLVHCQHLTYRYDFWLVTWPFSAEKFKMHTYDEVSLYCPSLPTTFHQLLAFNFQTCLTWYGSNRVHVELIASTNMDLESFELHWTQVEQLKFKLLHRYNGITFLRWKTNKKQLFEACALCR